MDICGAWRLEPVEMADEKSRRLVSDLLPANSSPPTRARAQIHSSAHSVPRTFCASSMPRNSISLESENSALFSFFQAGAQFPFNEGRVSRDGINRDSAIIGGEYAVPVMCFFHF